MSDLPVNLRYSSELKSYVVSMIFLLTEKKANANDEDVKIIDAELKILKEVQDICTRRGRY